MFDKDTKFPDYITFARTFENYKWYKPLLVLVVGLIIYFILEMLVILIFSGFYGFDNLSLLISGGYESMNSNVGVYFGHLGVAILLPSIYIASRIVKDRPFSSYSSSVGDGIGNFILNVYLCHW